MALFTTGTLCRPRTTLLSVVESLAIALYFICYHLASYELIRYEDSDEDTYASVDSAFEV